MSAPGLKMWIYFAPNIGLINSTKIEIISIISTGIELFKWNFTGWRDLSHFSNVYKQKYQPSYSDAKLRRELTEMFHQSAGAQQQRTGVSGGQDSNIGESSSVPENEGTSERG